MNKNMIRIMRLVLFVMMASLMVIACKKNKDDNVGTANVLSPYDMNRPVGFGMNVTGGNGQNVVTVTTQEELRNVLAGTEPATVYVKGKITLDNTISVGSNKSILGLSGAVVSNTHRDTTAGVFQLMGSDNIIIRNLTILGPGAYDIDANYSDNIALVGATNVWVDHCDIQDGIDGNMDIVMGSDNVCVSWTRFRYLIAPPGGGTGGNDDHRNSNLIGGSNNNMDIDGGKLNCTFINCWWGEGCAERCPRVRFGKVHVVNSLYNGEDFTYCIGYGVYSNIYVEKCAVITDVAREHFLQDYHGDKDFNVQVTGCYGYADTTIFQGEQGQFVPEYRYISYDAAKVLSVVTDRETGAGPTMDW